VDQAKEDRAEADSTELESNSTTNRRWEMRLTMGPNRQGNKEGGACGHCASWAGPCERDRERGGNGLLGSGGPKQRGRGAGESRPAWRRPLGHQATKVRRVSLLISFFL
jgi:hypothetical protein